VALHKWVTSLILGITFVKSGVSQKEYIINVLIFSFITPIGISIGMTLTNFSNDFIAVRSWYCLKLEFFGINI